MMTLAVALVAGDDPGGWSKAKWGMTGEEILKAFNGQVKRRENAEPGQRALVIYGLEIAGVKFDVSIGLDEEDKLLGVGFTPSDQNEESRKVLEGHASAQVLAMRAKATFQALENLLVEKYGRPWKSDEGTNSTEMQWTFPTTVITLSRRVVGSAELTLTWVHLIYKQRAANPL
jgi:hypothetical protein